MRCSRQQIALGMAVWCAGMAGQALGNVNNTARVTINPSFSGGDGPIDLIVTQPGTIDVSGSTTGGASSTGSGTSHVEYGYARTIGRGYGAIGGTSSVIINDSLMITSPGVPTGTIGTLRFTVTSSGSLLATAGSSVARWHLRADIGGGPSDLAKDGEARSPDLSSVSFFGDPLGTYSATASFRFGMVTSLHVEFSTNEGAGYSSNGPGNAEGDIRLHWDGIDEVKEGDNPVGTFTITSDSGTDWTGYIAGECPADFDGSGFVDTDDFTAFVLAFEAGTDDADVDGSGFVDTDDFTYYVVAFEAGC